MCQCVFVLFCVCNVCVVYVFVCTVCIAGDIYMYMYMYMCGERTERLDFMFDVYMLTCITHACVGNLWIASLAVVSSSQNAFLSQNKTRERKCHLLVPPKCNTASRLKAGELAWFIKGSHTS